MDYSFVEEIKTMQKDGLNAQEKVAFNSIIDTLFKKNLRGSDKLKDIDEFDGESLFSNTTLYPGCIYAFQYAAESPNVYSDRNITFEWSDGLPVVLITHIKGKNVGGINLNLCDYATKTHIINLLHNLDLNFYKTGAEEMYLKGQKPISNNVAKVFLNQELEKAFYEAVKKECMLKYTGFIYRNYNINRMKNPRLIETWQHKYIPFLRYTGTLKGDLIKLMWKISGISN